MSLVSRGFGTDGNASTIMLAGWAQQLSISPTYESFVTAGFGIDTNVGTIIRRGFSAYLSLPPAPGVGNQYNDITAIPAPGEISVIQGETPAVIGDVMLEPQVTLRQGYTLLINGDGSFIIDAGGDTTVQYFPADIFHVAAQAFDGTYTVFVNDPGPQLLQNIPPIIVAVGAAVSLDLLAAGYVSDPIGLGLTSSLVSGNLAGLSLSGTLISGTTNAPVNNTVSILLTDAALETLTVTFTLFVFTQVTVPDFTGVPLATASAEAVALQLILTTVATQQSNTIPAGDVLSQSPVGGTVVNQGTTISVTLSSGNGQPPIIPFATIQATIIALSAAGFVASPVFVYAYSSTVPDGYVISVAPPPASDVPINTAVQLTVSLGPPNPVLSTTVPACGGLPFLQAQLTLVAASLEVGTISWVYGSGVINRVVSQSVAFGSIVPLYTQVNLTFSAGPAVTYPGTGDAIVPPLPIP